MPRGFRGAIVVALAVLCSVVAAAGSARAYSPVIGCPCPVYYQPPPLPDLTVFQAGMNISGEPQFTVANIGQGNAGPFSIAVLAGAQSYSIGVSGLAAGQHTTYAIPGLSCGQPVFIIVDVANQVQESNENNNTLSLNGSCQIDGASYGALQSVLASV